MNYKKALRSELYAQDNFDIFQDISNVEERLKAIKDEYFNAIFYHIGENVKGAAKKLQKGNKVRVLFFVNSSFQHGNLM